MSEQPLTINDVLVDIPRNWKNIIIKKEKDSKILNEIIEVAAGNCTPSPNLWFEWARQTPLENIKVIIIGQDPYPTINTAHGLAFSSINKLISCPPSLRNIFKCLEQQKIIKDFKQTTTCLSSWAEQGVLLLNTAFSTEIGKRREHFSLWEDYVKRILVRILQYHIESDVIILCWGQDAQNLVNKITIKTAHKFHILNWSHPSPLTGNKFLSCDHFTITNKILEKNNKTPINWDSISLKSVTKQIIFTDGSASSKTNNGGNKKDATCKGGYAVVFIGQIQGNLLGSLETSQVFASNIRAEGQAIISALEKCHQELTLSTLIELYTDSEFWIKMINVYMPKWSDSNFDQKANPDMTRVLWSLWKQINNTHKVKLIHIYSHNKSGLKNLANMNDQFNYSQNELADKLATEARITLKPGEQKFVC